MTVVDVGLWVRLAVAVYTVLPLYIGCRGTYDALRRLPFHLC